jgi:hypothetical protein
VKTYQRTTATEEETVGRDCSRRVCFLAMAEVSLGGGDLLAFEMVQNMRAILLEEREKSAKTTAGTGGPLYIQQKYIILSCWYEMSVECYDA